MLLRGRHSLGALCSYGSRDDMGRRLAATIDAQATWGRTSITAWALRSDPFELSAMLDYTTATRKFACEIAMTRMKRAVAFFRRRGQGRAAKPLEHHRRQAAAFARAAGYEIVAEFSENMRAEERYPSGRGFRALLRYVEASGASTIIVASAGEFASDPVVRAVGYTALRGRGIELLAADGPTSSAENTLLVQQILELSADYEKLLVRAYREAVVDRSNIEVGPKHRKRYADVVPQVVEMAKGLHQLSHNGGRLLSFREISGKLAEAGHLNQAGKPYHAEEIRRMIKGPRPSISKP